jgi:cell division protein FtsB
MTRARKWALFAGAVAAGLAVLSATDARGWRRYVKIRSELAVLEQKRTALAAENAALRREIEALSGDRRALERAAREDLGLIRPNEIVFTFER